MCFSAQRNLYTNRAEESVHITKISLLQGLNEGPRTRVVLSIANFPSSAKIENHW